MKTLEKFFNATIFVVVVFTMFQTVTNTSYASELEVKSFAPHVLRAI